MDGKLKSIPGAWIPAIPAGMTILDCAFIEYDIVELSRIFKRLAKLGAPIFKRVVGANSFAQGD